MLGIAGQGADRMRQSHERVIAFHGVPVFSEGMLVGIALVLLYQKTGFNPPAVSSPEVAAGMDVEASEGATGYPGVFTVLGDDLGCVGIDFFPLLGTDDQVDIEMIFAMATELVTDLIDPAEMLSSISPISVLLIFFLVPSQAVILLPNGGK